MKNNNIKARDCSACINFKWAWSEYGRDPYCKEHREYGWMEDAKKCQDFKDKNTKS